MEEIFLEFKNKLNENILNISDLQDLDQKNIENIINDIVKLYKNQKITDETEILEIENKLKEEKISINLIFSIYLLYESDSIDNENIYILFANLLENKINGSDLTLIIKYYLEFLEGGINKLVEKVNNIKSTSSLLL